MHRLIKLFVSLFAFLALTQKLYGQSQKFVSLKDLQIYTGKSSNSFQQLHQSPDTLFTAYTQQKAQIRKNETYWLRFKLRNYRGNTPHFLLTHIRLDSAMLFFPVNQGDITYKKMISGISVPYNKWAIQTKQISFLFPQNYAQNEFIYLKIRSNFNTGFGIFVQSARDFLKNKGQNFFRYGIFFGIILLAFLYAIILYFVNKMPAYLYYALYVFSFGTFAAVDWGMIIPVLTWFNISWSMDLYTIPFTGITIFLLLYAKSFLQTKNHLPIFNQLIVAAALMRIIIYFSGTFFNYEPFYSPYIDNTLLLTAYAAGIIRWKQGFKPAQYLTIAFTILYAGFIFHSLRYIGLISMQSGQYLSLFKTGIIEIIAFYISLAVYMRMLKKDKEKASQDMIEYLKENSQLKDEMIKQLEEKKRLKENINLELEKKVVERTRELAEANEHINRMNRLLKNSNQKLQSDIQNIEEKRIHNKRVSFKEFQKLYPDNDTCYKYLSNLKWAHGFKCQICGNTKYSAGNTAYSRRCSRCNKIESATSRTVFSRSRIPLKKGFYMLFLIIDSPSVTIDELKNAVDLRRETCWAFRKKIMSAFNLQNGKKIKSQSWNDFILLE